MKSFLGEGLALLTTLSWSICVFPFTEASRRLGAEATNLFRLALAVVLLTLACYMIGGLNPWSLFLLPDKQNWIWLGLSGIVGLGFGDHFGFRMYAILGTRLGSIFTTISPGIALVTSYFLIGESLSLLGIAGIFITLLGISWFSLNKKEKDNLPDLGYGRKELGIIYGILAAACQGIGLVLAKKGLSGGHDINAIHATWIRMSLATLFILITSFARKRGILTIRTIRGNKERGLWFAFLGTLFGPVIGVSLSLYTIQHLEVSVAQTIFSLVPVMVLPIAILFYKEKVSRAAFVGVVIAVAGVMILIWRNLLMQYIFQSGV